MERIINLNKLIEEANEQEIEEHLESEAGKVGNLRAGNTGLFQEGAVVGKCHRLTFLRMKGIIVEEEDASRSLMFEAGHSNEDIWTKKLGRSYKGVIKREEEIPVSWKTTNETLVTGRPDIVLCDTEEKAIHGLELKLVSSLWTARDILGDKPKAVHLMQAAHYMWLLNIPFDLVYTSRVDFAVMGWAQRHFPAKGQPSSEHCEYNDNGEIKKVLPFLKIFELRLHKETLQYKVGNKWTDTIITVPRIKEFYEYISKMEEANQLGNRPLNLDAAGNKLNFSLCDYCNLKAHCDKYEERGLKVWLRNVPKIYQLTKKEEK